MFKGSSCVWVSVHGELWQDPITPRHHLQHRRKALQPERRPVHPEGTRRRGQQGATLAAAAATIGWLWRHSEGNTAALFGFRLCFPLSPHRSLSDSVSLQSNRFLRPERPFVWAVSWRWTFPPPPAPCGSSETSLLVSTTRSSTGTTTGWDSPRPSELGLHLWRRIRLLAWKF